MQGKPSPINQHALFIIPLALLGILLVACTPMQHDYDQEYESCRYNLMPTIEEFGAEHIVLGGNGEILKEGEVYRFEDVNTEVVIELVAVDNMGATFRYEETSYSLGEAPSIPPHTTTVRCDQDIAQDDELFQSRLRAFLLQPDDFEPDWVITNYTEYVVTEISYNVPPDDVVHVTLETEGTYTSETESAPIRYYVTMAVQAYESEAIAVDAFVGEMGTFKRPYEWRPSAGFASQLTNYGEGCLTLAHRRCKYAGIHGRYIVKVEVTKPQDSWPGISIPLEDWQRVVSLAEDRLLNAVKDTPILSLTPLPTATLPATPRFTPLASGANGRIAFSSHRDWNRDIYVIDMNDGNVARLTDDPSSDSDPTWSPDGSRIAFTSERTGSFDIYVMNSDGSKEIQLTNAPGMDVGPAWSPDGNHIAFTSFQNGSFDIYIMDPNGGNVTRLTNNPDSDQSPSWSPDSSHIVFESIRGGMNDWDIYVIDVTGDNVVRLTNEPSNERDPAWSPDGNHIAFRSDRAGQDDIYLMDTQGNNVIRLTSHPACDGAPAWSPDGKHIAFETCSGGFFIFAMDADGSDQVQLTYDSDISPSWGP